MKKNRKRKRIGSTFFEKPNYENICLNPIIVFRENDYIKFELDSIHLSSNTDQSPTGVFH